MEGCLASFFVGVDLFAATSSFELVMHAELAQLRHRLTGAASKPSSGIIVLLCVMFNRRTLQLDRCFVLPSASVALWASRCVRAS